MSAEIQQSELIQELKEAARQARSSRELMTRIVEALHDRMLKYNWAGFYMLDPKDSGVLELGPFVGAMTPHTRIPLHQGICGVARRDGGGG
jgi:L-methionine (R)-S-oxide reductase